MALTNNLTIMFTDMVGFTERTALLSRAQNKLLLRRLHGILLPVAARFGGRCVKTIGDALLLAFHSPTDAVRCGMALHDALADANRHCAPVDRLEIRVAINAGEVRLEGGDVYGEAVNVAARVESITPAGAVYLTEAVYLVMNKAEVTLQTVGEQRLKGVADPVRLFCTPRAPEGAEFPFGGLHRLPAVSGVSGSLNAALWKARTADWGSVARDSWTHLRQGVHRQMRLSAIALAGVTVCLTAWGLVVLLRPADATLEPSTPARPGVASASTAPAASREQATVHLYAGHHAFFANDRRLAVQEYATAMALDPGLADDPTLANRLVQCLSWASDVAAPVIQQHPSKAIIAELALRTAQGGARGRERAAELLRAMGAAGQIDQVGWALADLSESAECPAKLKAVQRLRALRSPRALPALRESVSGFFSNRCLRSEAKAAIEEIEAREGHS